MNKSVVDSFLCKCGAIAVIT